mgnify:CR=1 FL=1
MSSIVRCATTALFLLWAASSHAGDLSATAEAHDFYTPEENLVTGGQPSRDELAALKAAGMTKVINLRGPEEKVSFDPRAEAEALGMEYVSLPISGAGDVTADNARKLHQLLQQEDEPVFLHCASGNRVGALLAIAAHQIEGQPIEASLELGRSAGLGSLEAKVRSVLDSTSPSDQ